MDQEMHRLIFLSLVLLGVERLIIFILYTHRSTPVNKRRETELPTTGSQVPTEPLDYRGSWLGDPVVGSRAANEDKTC